MRKVSRVLLWLVCAAGAVGGQEGGGLPDPGLPALIRRVKPAIVSLVACDPDKALPSTGTGFLVAPDRLVTCRHVILRATRVEVRRADGLSGQVVGLLAENLDSDLALLKIEPPAEHVTPLPVTDAVPDEGAPILVIGGPLGLEWTSSTGMISALRPLDGGRLLLQHTAPISAGSSGGPILDLRGQVIGMQSAMIIANEKAVQAGQGLNFAVPGREIAALRPGPLRSLAKARDELTADWRPPINRQIDTVSLRPFSRGDFAGALPYFQAAVAREPEVADHWLRLGLCHENLSSYTPAAEAYRRCVALDPGCAMGWNNLGVVAIRQRRYDEAIVAISKALALRPDLALAYANLADAYHRQGRHDEAIKVCAQALTRNRNNAEARYVLGLAYLGLGRTDLALEQARLLEPLDRAQAERLRQKAEPGPPR